MTTPVCPLWHRPVFQASVLRKLRWFKIGLFAALASSFLHCRKQAPPPEQPVQTALTVQAEAAPAKDKERPNVDRARLSVFGSPLPANYDSKANPATPEKVALGRQLYYEKRLSKNHDLSCNSCHDLARYGVDGAKFSTGHKKQLGGRNSPSVYMAAGHIAQFWDGRAKDVEEQAGGPMVNPVEMALPDHKRAEAVLQSIAGYVETFARAFPGEKQPITIKNITAAIAAFERQLVTPSRFDKYLGGEEIALNDVEKAGLVKFLDTGCVACHSGTLLGGTGFQKLGAVKPWPNAQDTGRAQVSKNDADRFLFKVPSLRNVAKTAPYFHDGSSTELSDAIRKMATHQLGRDLSDADVQSIAAFLESLTGDVPVELIAEPPLPPSGKNTPKPDAT